ncbi:MAG: ribonuclease D [Gammaproteobacteria bacterium]|nr:ribonuclease D [Gammaproteobacteria bacterium]
MTEILYIDRAEALESLCRRLEDQPWLAVDTEFLRERTYYPRLCLVQVAGPRIVACVDVLALEEADPLLDLLCADSAPRIFHAARQDLEALYGRYGRAPTSLFDTQIAANLLGYGDQIGYAALVEAVTGTRLAKGHSRTDWSRRPLLEEQLHYAADDVRYLGSLFETLAPALQARGRRTWLAEEVARLTDPAGYVPAADTAWQRVRGAQRLPPTGRSALKALAAWRERRAQSADRPRQWIARDETLLALAQALPDDRAALERTLDGERRLASVHGSTLLALIGTAASRDTEPAAASSALLDRAQQALVKRLMQHVRRRAAEHDISPGLLATRRDVERLVRGESPVPFLEGWRRGVIGEELAALAREAAG